MGDHGLAGRSREYLVKYRHLCDVKPFRGLAIGALGGDRTRIAGRGNQFNGATDVAERAAWVKVVALKEVANFSDQLELAIRELPRRRRVTRKLAASLFGTIFRCGGWRAKRQVPLSALTMHIAVIFINIGSYHAARLRAAAVVCHERGWRLTGIQVTNDTLEHAWGDRASQLEIPIVTLMRRSADGTSDLHAPFSQQAAVAVREGLDELKPHAVLIPGGRFRLRFRRWIGVGATNTSRSSLRKATNSMRSESGGGMDEEQASAAVLFGSRRRRISRSISRKTRIRYAKNHVRLRRRRQ